MSIEWMIIFMGTIAACAYFSYNAGADSAVEGTVESVLNTLAQADLIDVDDEGNISSHKSKDN